MKVTFLGTGTSTGVPIIGCKCEVCKSKDPKDNRTRTSIYIESNGVKLVVDTGPDFRLQMLREGIDDIDAVLFTHSHKDHVAGLDDIRPINYLKEKEIEVYANASTIKCLKAEYPYIFANNYPGVPQIQLNEIKENEFSVKGLRILPIHAMHGKMPVLGFRMNDFSYLTDANFISKEEIEKMIGSQVLVVNGLQYKKHYSHFTVEEALELIQKVQPQKAYLIHMSHKLGLHKAVEKTLPKNVFLSYDGLTIVL